MIHFKIFEKINNELIENLKKKKNNQLYLFQLTEWINVVINNSKNLYKLKIVFIYNYNDIILIAPFCIRNIYGCKELCWISSDIIDYNNAIISENFDYNDKNFLNVWKIIQHDLQKECDLVFFNKNPEFILSKKNPLIDSNYKHYQKSYQLNLKKFDYETFYNNKNNTKSKQTDKRKQKKLEQNGDLFFSCQDIDMQNFHLIEQLISAKISSYKINKEKTFDYNNIVNQYRELVSLSNVDYKFNVSILKKKDIKISSILGVICNEIYYYLIPVVHNSDFKNLSPGKFHIINLINWSIQNNFRAIDFTAGDEPYKQAWSNNEFKIFYYIHPLSFKGIIRFFFLNFYYKFRKNIFLKKIYYYIQNEI